MYPRDHSLNGPRPRLLWLGLLALLFGGGPDARAGDWVEGEVIVSFDKNASAAEKAGALGLLDAEVVREYRFIDAALCRLRSATVESVIDGKLALPGVIDVEPNLVLQPCWMPDDPLFGSQWYLHHTAAQAGTPGADIRAVHAWDVERGSREVIVAVIDEYIDYTHPDLWPNVFVNANEIADNGIDDDANGYIDDVHGLRLWSGYPSLSNEHGLVCAGVVTAAADNAEGIAGVADVTLLPVAVGDGGINFLDASGAIAGIEYAMLMGADVISLSYGSFHAGWLDTGLQAACRAAGEAGIFMTFSAGNDGLDPLPAPFYPACFDVDRIISVGGSDLLDHNAFNAHPEWVDVAAPGVAIRTCGLDGSYVSVGGTSLAAPMVAGVLALGISKYGDQPGFDAKARLLATADRIPALEGKNVVGGRINAFLMVAEPDATPPGAVTDFAIVNAASNWAIAGWTAAGDDGGSGRASRHDLRISTQPIDESNFALATPVATTPVPVAAGGAQAATIAGLAPDETYHVAMRTFDEWGAYHERLGGDWSRNAAPLVTATFTTQPAPTIAVAPLNPFVKVRQGAAGACTVSVANVGTGVLDFAVSDPSGAGRVRFEPAAGTLLGGEAADILVTLDVAAQGCGETAYPLVVRSNDPTAAEVAVSITVGVTGPGDVEIADPQLAFGGVPVGERAALSLTVSNRGCSDLAVLATAFSNPDFAYGGGAMPGTPVLVIAPQSSGELPVLYAPTELAADTGTLLLTTADGDEPVVAVQLTGIGTTYPGAGLSADTVFSPQLWTNGSGTTLLGITNTGGADLTFAFAADLPPWLTIEPGGGTIAAGHTVQVAFAFSAAQRCGDATGSVSLTTNAPGQELLVIPCVALVTPAPVLDAPLVLHVDAVGALDVVNRGCAGHPLTISGVTFSDPQWCSTTTTFPRVVQPGRRSVISVEANHGGWTTSGMVIHSDDPLKPHYPVVIVGLGGPGAAAAIAPPSPEPGAALAVPNPFNPSTQLLLSLERSAAVTVDIFDVRGHRVRHAALGTRAAGMVSFDWNGRDDSGGALPSGTYFYRFSTDGESGGASGKLTLLR